MKIWASSSRYVVVRSWRVWSIAIIYARSMFCSPGSLFVIFRVFDRVIDAISFFLTFPMSMSCSFRWFE